MNFQKQKTFFSLFLSPSNEKSAFWRFLPCCSLASYVFLSPPFKSQIQTITRQAVILPASGMSEKLLMNSHITKKKKKKQEQKTAAWLVCDICAQIDSVQKCGSDWLADNAIHITAAKNILGDRKGGLSLWLWLIQARGSTDKSMLPYTIHSHFFMQNAVMTYCFCTASL